MLLKIAEIFHTDVTILIFGTPDTAERKKDIRRLIAAGLALFVLVLFYRYADSWQQILVKQYYDGGLGFFMYLILLPVIFLLAGWIFMQLIKFFLKAKKFSGKGVPAVFYTVLTLMILYFLSVIPICVETGIVSWQNILLYTENPAQYPVNLETPFSFPSPLHMWSSNFSMWVLEFPLLLFCAVWILGGVTLWNGPGKRFPFHRRREKEVPPGTPTDAES